MLLAYHRLLLGLKTSFHILMPVQVILNIVHCRLEALNLLLDDLHGLQFLVNLTAFKLLDHYPIYAL
jgi:hypothetical protein